MNWQPIETAPAGKSVLACNSLGYVGRAILLNGKWEHIGKPTHWMPLPAAPGAPAVDESFEDRISDWAHGDALDAARYRWLRDNATRSGVNIDIGAGVEISATLDAAVDDAMRLTAAKGPQ